MKKIGIRIAFAILIALTIFGIVAAIEYIGAQPMGIFAGSRPPSLGFQNGKFKPPSWKPNCVSSTIAKDDSHYIAPFPMIGDGQTTWTKLVELVKAAPGTTLVVQQPGYLYAEFKSAGLGFVDDVEFALDVDNAAIQVRSASRLGIRDFGVNRKRIEHLRQALATK